VRQNHVFAVSPEIEPSRLLNDTSFHRQCSLTCHKEPVVVQMIVLIDCFAISCFNRRYAGCPSRKVPGHHQLWWQNLCPIQLCVPSLTVECPEGRYYDCKLARVGKDHPGEKRGGSETRKHSETFDSMLEQLRVISVSVPFV
jgi:hypothetical protein